MEDLPIHIAVMTVEVLALLLIGHLDLGMVTMDMVVDMETLAVVNLVVTVETPHLVIPVVLARMLVVMVGDTVAVG
uniref:RNA recognition motif-containing protein n=1 Tax=Solanum tuberosum TaxID=4113 RepID=M1D6C1_SOLTU